MKPPINLNSGNTAFMWTTSGERPPSGSVHYAYNMLPLSTQSDSSRWMQRGGFSVLGSGTAAGTSIRAIGQLSKVDGTQLTWLYSSTDGIWTYDWGAGTYTQMVTDGQLLAASVLSIDADTYWCIYNNTVVFNPSGGSHKPWVWDGGTGSASITRLDAAPICYGRPTVYAAKLFFIKNTARDTIVWSEEDDATTGYESGGFSNFWKLGQTGTNPLYAIEGTNEALYYFRGNSIGAIRGAVNTDFTTTATHDAVSTSTGTTSPLGVKAGNRGVWFLDQWFVPSFLPYGGNVSRIADETILGPGTNYSAEPMGFDRTFRSEPEDPGPVSGQVLCAPVMSSLPYETVWFNLPSSLNPGRVCLVVDEATQKPLAWVAPAIDASNAMHKTFAICKESSSGQSFMACADGTSGRLFQMGANRRPDQDTSGTAQSTVYRLIGAPLGTNQVADMQFDRLSVVTSVRSGTHSLSLQTLTSRKPTSSVVSTAQTQTLPASTAGVPQRLMYGLSQNGRWIRPVFTLTTSTAEEFAIDGWLVSAYPLSTSPTVP